jgi:multiple sugar transport system permease protein
MFAVIIADTWKQFPFVALLLYAGLQIIPEELYEAAKVDGGNVVQRFVKITLPMIKPMILVALIFRTMSALRIFDIVYSMTGGGPANTTNTLLHSAYIYLFKDMNFGLGSTMSTIIFILIMIICMIYIKTLGRDE